MRFFRDLFLLSLALLLAYGGGYYFGRHPESLRDLINSKSLVIATTEEGIFTQEVQHWIEDRWGHSLIVVLISEAEIANRIQDSDLIVAPLTMLKPLKDQFKDSPENLPREWILTDLLQEDPKSFPLLWKLLPMDQSRWRLVELGMSWTPRSEPRSEVVRWLLSRQAQTLMAGDTGFLPVRKDLLEESGEDKKLRSIPLSKLSYE